MKILERAEQIFLNEWTNYLGASAKTSQLILTVQERIKEFETNPSQTVADCILKAIIERLDGAMK